MADWVGITASVIVFIGILAILCAYIDRRYDAHIEDKNRRTQVDKSTEPVEKKQEAHEVEESIEVDGKKDYVPLNEEAVLALKGVPRRIGSDYVFATGQGNGKPKPHRLNRDFIRAVKGSGIEACSHRTLRHTFASHLAEAGLSQLRIMELMRYSSLSMTQRYTHLICEEGDRSVDKLSFMGSESETEEVVGG